MKNIRVFAGHSDIHDRAQCLLQREDQVFTGKIHQEEGKEVGIDCLASCLELSFIILFIDTFLSLGLSRPPRYFFVSSTSHKRLPRRSRFLWYSSLSGCHSYLSFGLLPSSPFSLAFSPSPLPPFSSPLLLWAAIFARILWHRSWPWAMCMLTPTWLSWKPVKGFWLEPC